MIRIHRPPLGTLIRLNPTVLVVLAMTFIGAMLGTGYGQAIHALWPAAAGPAGAYGLVGMGAVFAAVARAPMTAVIIIFELTGEYHIILPLMFAIALSAGVGNLLSWDTI